MTCFAGMTCFATLCYDMSHMLRNAVILQTDIRPGFKSSIWKNRPSPWEIWTFKWHFEVNRSDGSVKHYIVERIATHERYTILMITVSANAKWGSTTTHGSTPQTSHPCWHFWEIKSRLAGVPKKPLCQKT